MPSRDSDSATIPKTLADDLLSGVGAIAHFYYGEDTPENRRRIYRLVSAVAKEKRLPVFRDGWLIKARKSRLLQWIADQENGIN